MAAAESERDAEELISRLGKQFNTYKTCPNKDTLVKLLKQALSALPRLKQMESLNPLMRPLSDSLIKHGLLQHKDKDIRLLVATCFCEIIRVLAPDPRYSDKVLRDIFKLLLSVFREIVDITSPYFSRRVKLLETVAKLNFCVLMLDIGCEDLILEMFKIFFSVAREKHPHNMIIAMSSIVTRVLDEKLEDKDLDPLVFEEKFSEPLLDVIFLNLLKEATGESTGSARLALSVIQSCSEKPERLICTFLRSCILNRDIIESEVKESYHEIIYEIFRIAPQMLLSVIPSLSHELLTDKVDVRIKALNLIKRFFALPGHNVAEEYRNLFMEFVNRLSDKASEVRLCALSCAKAYLSNPTGTESVEVLSAIEIRLLDFDDRVRTQAMILVCDVVRSKMNSISRELICLVTDRLRDKKVSVRKKALPKLLELYHDYCTKCVDDKLMPSDHFEQIPSKILMLCYDKDCKEFRPQSLELVFAEDLFPDSLPIEDRTLHWIYLFSLFTPLHLKALNIILSQKRRLRDALQAYLDLLSQKNGIGSEEKERRMKTLIAKMSCSFPDPGEAEVWFHQLKEVKDSDILRMLRELLNVGDAHSVHDHLLRTVGERSPLFEFLRLLSAKCLLNIFSSGHICCIFDQLTIGDCVENKRLKGSAVQLLLTIISAYPLLLRSSEKRFVQLLAKDVIPFNEQLIQILAKEGSNMCLELSDIYCLLERVCLEGTRAHAKLAVIAIKALSGSSKQIVFSKLCKVLLDSLHLSHNLPTALQSLGCIAQHCPSAFETQEEEISSYILEEVFPLANVSKSNGLNLYDETSECCKSCKLKIYGLKTQVRSFLPKSGAPVSRNLNYLLDIITKVLRTGSFSDTTVTCLSDAGNIQLAAAKSVLMLSRKWDLHISPLIFRLTMLVAKDNSPLVRRLFINKVNKLLKEHAVPCRYACAFSFASLDSDDDLCDNSLKYMGEYIKMYTKRAGIEKSATLSVGLLSHPAYMIVFLIHILAHDAGFPTMECQDEAMYIKPASPLLFSIQALLSTDFYDNDSEVVNTALYLRIIFIAIKRAEDAIDSQVTPNLHLLADLGISLLHASSDSTSVSTTGNHELILLPSSLYKVGSADRREDHCASSSLNKTAETLIRKLTQRLANKTSKGPHTIKKHGEQCCEEDSLTTDANKTHKSKLTFCMRSSSSRTQIIEQKNKLDTYQKELRETSNMDADAGGKCLAISSLSPKTSELHNEFSIRDELDMCATTKFATISNEQLPSSCDSVATKCTLGQKEVQSSCSTEIDVITRWNSRPAKISKLATTNHCKPTISEENKDKVEKKAQDHLLVFGTDKSHLEHSSVSSEFETFDLVGYDCNRKPMKENTNLCSNQILLHENIRKVQESKPAVCKANVKEDDIGRRTRKRKI